MERFQGDRFNVIAPEAVPDKVEHSLKDLFIMLLHNFFLKSLLCHDALQTIFQSTSGPVHFQSTSGLPSVNPGPLPAHLWLTSGLTSNSLPVHLWFTTCSFQM